jgi:hypothetical protein
MATTAASPALGIFASPFFSYVLLPFLLVFVLVYAIMEKAQILGENKRYANVIIAMVIAFIFVGVPAVVGITLKIIPIVTLILVILLCFLLLFGIVNLKLTKGINIALGIILSLALIITVAWATGILNSIHVDFSSPIVMYVIFGVILVGVVVLVVAQSPKKSGSG